MVGERTHEGWQVRLRPHGLGRFFTAAFLSVWLCGWAAGEGFALWILIKGAHALFTGRALEPGHAPLQLTPALAAGGFLLVWLSIWTVGGIAALWTLLSAVWAEDRILVGAGGVTLRWSRGPFRGRREFPRDRLRGFGLGAKGALIVEMERERAELSALGTPEERRLAVESLRAETSLPAIRDGVELPKGWEEIITPEGERAILPDRGARRIQARVAAIAALGMLAILFVILQKAMWEPGLIPTALVTGAFALGLGYGALRLACGRIEYRIGSGSITVRKRFRDRASDLLEIRKLQLGVTSDSDGDGWFHLDGLSSEASEVQPVPRPFRQPRGRRTIVSVIHDPTVPRLLGAWMARGANVPLLDGSNRESRQAEIAAVTEILAQSGRWGRRADGSSGRRSRPASRENLLEHDLPIRRHRTRG